MMPPRQRRRVERDGEFGIRSVSPWSSVDRWPGFDPVQPRSQQQEFARLQAWSRALPVDEIFDKIYAEARWGRSPNGARFYSGMGSRPQFTAAYERLVIDLIAHNPQIRTIVDLGCGDFQVADRILKALDRRSRPVDYVGCDIAKNVVAHNQTAKARQGVRFVQANIMDDGLPAGDVALVRQVLQHLTNDDITKALANIRKTYPVAIITESLPTKRIAPNADIARGISTRVPLGSGVYLDEPPFSLRIRKTLDVPFSEGEFIRSSVTHCG